MVLILKGFFFSKNLRYKRRESLNIKNDDILIGMIARNHPIKDYVTSPYSRLKPPPLGGQIYL